MDFIRCTVGESESMRLNVNVIKYLSKKKCRTGNISHKTRDASDDRQFFYSDNIQCVSVCVCVCVVDGNMYMHRLLYNKCILNQRIYILTCIPHL